MTDFELARRAVSSRNRLKVTGSDHITNFAMSKVLPVLHRQLLRLARGLDAYPLSKALLLAQPDAPRRLRTGQVWRPGARGVARE